MQRRWIIGLASGCSVDGIDVVLMQIQGIGVEASIEQLHVQHQPFSPEMRETLLKLDNSESSNLRSLGRLHRILGETYAAAARSVADSAGVGLARIQVIGSSGHTVSQDHEGRFPGSLSLGMSAVIAERTGVTVVSEFKARDLAAGGQGTSLGVLPDYMLFRHATQARLILHLGGIAGLVYLPPGCRLQDVIGLEAGPCGLVLDALIRQLTGGREWFDAGGKRAVQGRCLEALLQSWLAHPLLHRRPPRSFPRSVFADEFARRAVESLQDHHGSLHDLLCTATHFVAHGIHHAIRRYLPISIHVDRVYLSGGGVRNGFLLHLLQQQFQAPLARTDELGVPAASRQAMSYGLLAALTLDGVPGNAPSVTGAAGSRLLGHLTPGASSNWGRCLNWMAQHVGPTALMTSDY